MNIDIAPYIRVSATTNIAIDIFNGIKIPITSGQAARLRQLTTSSSLLESTDLPLLERGLIMTIAQAQSKRREIEGIIKSHLESQGSLCIMPTEKCNFRCTYCYESFLKGRMSATLTEAVKIFLERNVPQYSFYNLAFFGGEPLAHIDIIEDITRFYRNIQIKSGRSGTVAITTNGYLLNNKAIDTLQNVGIDLYHISLDGPKILHDSQRKLAGGRGTYEVIWSNILSVLQHSNARIMLRINLDTRNAENSELVSSWVREKIVELSEFIDRVSINVVAIWDATSTSVDGICIREVAEFQRWLAVRQSIASELGHSALDAMLEESRGIGTLSCYAGKPGHYIVGSDGMVYKCSVAFDLEENQVGQLLPSGDLILNKELDAHWTSINVTNDPKCGKCAFGASCMGLACPLVRIQSGTQPCPTHKRYLNELLNQS